MTGLTAPRRGANRDALEFRVSAVRAGALLIAQISRQRREANLVEDPRFSGVLTELCAKARSEWNPAEIKVAMASRSRDRDVLRRWANAAQPEDALRWEFAPEINRLDG